MKLVRNQKGSALVWVMVTLAVVLVLATGMAGLSINEARSAARLTRKTQAYYIARAGAEAAADWILGLTGDDLADFNAMNFPLTGSIQPFGEGSYQVEIRKSGSAVTVAAKGSVDDVPVGGSGAKITQMAEVILKQPENGIISQFPYAVYGHGQIDFNGGSIVGRLGTSSTAPGAIRYNSWDHLPGVTVEIPIGADPKLSVQYLAYNSPKFAAVTPTVELPIIYPIPVTPPIPPFSCVPPTGLIDRGTLSTAWSGPEATVSASGYYDLLKVENNQHRLVFDTSRGDLVIHAKQLVVNGAVDIVGNGHVSLYTSDFSANSYRINASASSSADQLSVYYRGYSFRLPDSGAATSVLNANLYVESPNAALVQGRVSGSVFANTPLLKLSSGNAFIGGNVYSRGSLEGSDVVIQGDVIVHGESTTLTSGNLQVKGNIYATGNVDIQGVNAPFKNIISSGSSVKLGWNVSANGVVYAPLAHVNISSTRGIRGAVVGDFLELFGTNSVISTPVDPINIGTIGTSTSPYEFQYRQ